MFTDKQSISKGERREHEILQTAAQLFSQKGFHATSLEDIATAVGIRKSGLYYYAQTKDDLLFRLVQQGLQPMIDELQAIGSSDRLPTEKLRRAIATHIRYMDTQWSTMGVILREDRSVAPQHRDAYVAMRDRYESLFRALVDEGVAAGVFRRCDPTIITRAILGMCSWLVVWYQPGGGLSAESISEQYIDFVFKGLAQLDRA